MREDIARITQALAHELEQLIRAAPEQWHMLAAELAERSSTGVKGWTACGS